MYKRQLRFLSGIILAFVAMMGLTSCVLIIRNNWGTNIQAHELVDNSPMSLAQEYEADTKINKNNKMKGISE